MTPEQASEIVRVFEDALTLAAQFYPPLAIASPILNWIVAYEVGKLQAGIANGTIIPDGKGGYVPVTNSHYDPKTGEFL